MMFHGSFAWPGSSGIVFSFTVSQPLASGAQYLAIFIRGLCDQFLALSHQIFFVLSFTLLLDHLSYKHTCFNMLSVTLLTLIPLLAAGAPHNFSPRQTDTEPSNFCGLGTAADGGSFSLTNDNNKCTPFGMPIDIFTLEDFGSEFNTGGCEQCIFYE
jgi:hypothetical protein